ncbi:hypothetical protein [Amycolatopsis sp.]|uniref:hypothetical protein n=1 Tax=Amycolatopsis sp. TaxID=37632 RepID=UPI002E08728E|nr:hypothetical protein [Amycolatopsis sp.]
MTASEHGAADLSVLYRLHAQLKILVPTVAVAAGHPETTAMLAGVRETTAGVAGLLDLVEPEALAALRRALDHAAAGEFDESCSELTYARQRLAVLLRRDDRPRRPDAATEPTLRWTLNPESPPSPWSR